MKRSCVLPLWLLVLMPAACRDSAPRPVPPPSAPAAAAPASDGLRPLTSRDVAPAAPAADASSLPPGHPPIAGGTAPAPSGPAVSGRVSLASALASRSGAALFIIARNQAGQIVAVRKEAASSFPVAFTISAADAMTAGTSFEGRLDLTARLSQTGDAIPVKGDIEGTTKGVVAGARDVAIVLDSVRQ